MKLLNALQFRGNLEVIGEGRDELPEFFKAMGYKVGAEIGAYRGGFTKKFCEAGLKMYAIDPWTAYLGAGRTENKQEKQDLNYEEAKKTLAPYPDCVLVRKTSMDALEDFEDESLDFVYIDGDHTLRYAIEDIVEWSKKVRKGGAVSGHDYFNTPPHANNVLCHVKAALDAYASIYNINFYTLIKENPVDSNDRTPSWMFIK